VHQLEQLKARRAAIDLQRAEFYQQAALPAEEVEKAVADYCAAAARNLRNFTDDEWRQMLRTIIQYKRSSITVTTPQFKGESRLRA
jgi:hypothetical protein